jgi:hypothetical protein
MIRVNVHLDSAISRSRDIELARVLISNVGGTDEHGDYACVALYGRSTKQLDKRKVQRRGEVKRHARKREHVLNLVTKALLAMGYGPKERNTTAWMGSSRRGSNARKPEV